MKKILLSVVTLCAFIAPAYGAVIEKFEDFAAFSSQFDSVQVFPVDDSDFGTPIDENNPFYYQLELGGLVFEFEGPANYLTDFPSAGITVLSKAAPMEIVSIDPVSAKGVGFYIYQYGPVDITAYDENGDTYPVVGYSNNGGSPSAFLGFTSPDGISKIEILGDGLFINISHVAIGLNAATPEEQLEALLQKIDSLAPDSLRHGQANGLSRKLLASIKALNREEIPTACNTIEAFVAQTNGLVNAGQLLSSDGDALLSEVEFIKSDLSCAQP